MDPEGPRETQRDPEWPRWTQKDPGRGALTLKCRMKELRWCVSLWWYCIYQLRPSGPSQCLHCTMWRWWRRSDDGMWPLRCAHQDNVRPRRSAMFSHGGLSVHFWRTALSLVRYFHAIDGTFRCLQLDISKDWINCKRIESSAVQWSETEEQLRICWNSFLFWSLHFWHLQTPDLILCSSHKVTSLIRKLSFLFKRLSSVLQLYIAVHCTMIFAILDTFSLLKALSSPGM